MLFVSIRAFKKAKAFMAVDAWGSFDDTELLIDCELNENVYKT